MVDMPLTTDSNNLMMGTDPLGHEAGSLVQHAIHDRGHIASRWQSLCRVLQFSRKPRFLPTVEHGWKHDIVGFRRRIGLISVIILSEA